MHSSRPVLRHILVGTDFSPCADAALEAAIALATLSSSRVTLVHVCELSFAVSGSEIDELVIADCRNRLEAEVARRAGCGVELAPLMRIGRPVEKINNAAAEVGASLIVVGRSGADRAVELGSVADRVVRTASRPVLIVCAKESA